MTGGSAELHRLDATTALRLFRSRELSPVELMEALITRIEDVDDAVNALSERLFDTALASAREAADRYARGRGITPLLGLPVAAKEKHGIAATPCRRGWWPTGM